MNRHVVQCCSDQISNLPNSIIGHILSFLPIKKAIRTSILSKRWIHLWTFITKLHFEDRKPWPHHQKKINKTSFLKFVNRVLLHLNASSIQSLSLSLSQNYDPYHVNLWISAILSRGAKNLCIDSKKKLDIIMHPLLMSHNLEELILVNGCALRVPSFVSFSSLAVLELCGITITCDSSNDSEKLNFNLPVLRKLNLGSCTWLNVKGVTFEVPLLEVLLIKQTSWSISRESHTQIKFCACRLTQFSCTSYMLQDTITLELEPSTHARIASANIYPHKFKEESEEETALLVYRLLKQFHNNVECLKIERSEILELARDSLVADPLKFEMLSHLELEKVAGEILVRFLIYAPFLKTLILKELLQFGEELCDSEFVPHCFKSNLQEIYFGRLNGDEHELRFAKYVLENAQVLETANFSATLELRKSNFKYVRESILSFKRSDRFLFMQFSSYYCF